MGHLALKGFSLKYICSCTETLIKILASGLFHEDFCIKNIIITITTDPTRLPSNCTEHVRFVEPEEMKNNVRRRIPNGDNVELNCKATGNPTPRITWFKDGKRFSRFGNDPDALDPYMDVLDLRQFAFADTGKYTCNVSNGCSWINFTYFLDNKGLLLSIVQFI